MLDEVAGPADDEGAAADAAEDDAAGAVVGDEDAGDAGEPSEPCAAEDAGAAADSGTTRVTVTLAPATGVFLRWIRTTPASSDGAVTILVRTTNW